MQSNLKRLYVRGSLVAGGAFYVITAGLLLFASAWFYANIGNYPPYNRHYAGDAGAFLLVCGLVLLWAARDPARYRGIIALVAFGSLTHALNHVIDDILLTPSDFSILNNIMLFVLAFSQFLAAWWAVPTTRPQPARHPA